MKRWGVFIVAFMLIWSTNLFAQIFVDSCYGKTAGIVDAETTNKETKFTNTTINVLIGENVVEMDMTEYLTGVLLCEIPADFHVEAKKAQAVVARTYAMRTAEIGQKHGEGIVCADPDCCQGYISADEYVLKWNESKPVGDAMSAVNETAGEVLTWNQQLIDATYFSCSGGKTESAVAVWGSDIPYLKSVDSPGEEDADHYLHTVCIPAKELEIKLNIIGTGNPTNWIEHVSHTEGNGVESISICGKRFSGTQVRTLLGLRSTNFTITATPDSFIITTKGFGHRVGMSQYGADAMAQNGSNYHQILHHYYSDVLVASWE